MKQWRNISTARIGESSALQCSCRKLERCPAKMPPTCCQLSSFSQWYGSLRVFPCSVVSLVSILATGAAGCLPLIRSEENPLRKEDASRAPRP